MSPARRPWWPPLLCAVTLALGAAAASAGFADLLVSARPSVRTACDAGMLLGGAVAGSGALSALSRWWARAPAAWGWAWAALGLVAAALSWLVFACDFLTTAFRGVG